MPQRLRKPSVETADGYEEVMREKGKKVFRGGERVDERGYVGIAYPEKERGMRRIAGIPGNNQMDLDKTQ